MTHAQICPGLGLVQRLQKILDDITMAISHWPLVVGRTSLETDVTGVRRRTETLDVTNVVVLHLNDGR